MSTDNSESALSRRTFLAGSVGAALMMGLSVTFPTGSAQAALAQKQFSPTVWFEISSKGLITVNIAKAEMGQHVGTALARVVADELGANWNDVEIQHVDTDPKWGYMITGGSWSVFNSFKQLSQAGAAGRMVLLEAGAKLLGQSVSDCKAQDSWIKAGKQQVSYADIVKRGDIDRVFTAKELDALPLMSPKKRRLVGKESTALDIPAKVNGSAQYGIDVEIPGMVYARPVIPPTRYGSVITNIDDSAAKNVAGYQGYHRLSDPSETLQGWVCVTADNYWSAVKAADELRVQWKAGPTATVSEKQIIAEGSRLAKSRDAGFLLVNDGDVEKARKNSTDNISATYTTATALHFQMEPVNATVEFNEGVWHIHAGNQWQSLILPVLAKALAVEEKDIVIHQYYLGGGFGRRLFGDYMIPAALTAKAVGKPVKMIFTRPDDSRFDCVRSASVQHFTASMSKSGKVTGIEHAAAAGWPTLTMAPSFLFDSVDKKGKIDGFSISGADHWYSLENHRVRAINNDLAQRSFLPGWLRAVGPGWIGWGVESFMDELAQEVNKDPIDFRLSMLDGKGKNAGKAPESVGGAKRQAAVLKRVKKQSGWGKKLPANEGMGVATAYGQERTMPTWVACVAHVAVNKSSGKVDVKKLSLTIDCGTVVHPDGALAQAQSSALWGVSLALHEGSHFKKGQVADTNLDTYSPLRIGDIPELDIEFVDNDQFPVGMGEPPLIVVAPAIANAVFAAVGVRVRDLPIRPEAVAAELKA